MNRIKYLFTIATLLLLCIDSMAQTFTLKGRVTDEKMNPVEMATVVVPSQGKVGMTSLKGEFNLTLQTADTVEVKFSMIGFVTKSRKLIKPKGTQTLQVVLKEADNVLGTVTVREIRRQTGQTQTIKPEAIKMGPTASGNAVEELIQTQAGVSSHNEMSSQYNVRGGSFDENSVYINNIEVYRPFLVRSGQQEGLSVINADMVEKIGFSSGGFAAKYGDKMSSALDITYKRPKKFEANITASMLGASGYVGIATPKLTWLNGLRYKTTAYLLGSLETKGEYNPHFVDYQTYLSYAPNKRWQIDFIGNIADNHFDFVPHNRETKFGTLDNVKSFKVYFDGQEKDRFVTYFGNLSIKRNFGEQTSLALLTSAYYTNERETYDIQGQYWLTQTETSENLGVGTYFEHARNYLTAKVQSAKLLLTHKTKKHEIETALTWKHENIKERSVEYEMRDSSGYSIPHTGKDLYMIYSLKANNQLKSNRLEYYIQDTYRFALADEATLFNINYGMRVNHWFFNKETILSPRVSVGVIPKFAPQTTFRFATGIYYQAPFFKELRDTTTVLGVTTAKLNANIKSQRSIHFIAGADYNFKVGGRPFKLTGEMYYKILSNLVPYSINNVKVVYDGNNRANGYAVGLDVKLFGEFVPGTDSWISLSLLKANMNLNGKTIPLPTDQRVGINLFFTDYFPGSERWKMLLKMVYADGLPFTPPHKGYDSHVFRAPAYKRVDIGMSYLLTDNTKKSRPGIFKQIWLGLDCLNLFGINNINSYYWITDVTNHQYAVPNYLTGRQLNAKIRIDF